MARAEKSFASAADIKKRVSGIGDEREKPFKSVDFWKWLNGTDPIRSG